MQQLTPLGQPAPLAQSAGVNTAQPAAVVAPLTPALTPTFAAPVAQPMPTEAPVMAPAPTPNGCSMNTNVVLETRASIELPWNIFDQRFDCAFIGKGGQLVVATNAPLLDTVSDDWIVEGEAIEFGVVTHNAEYWRNSLTLRPDEAVTEVVEEAAHHAPVEDYTWLGTEVEEEPVAVEPAPAPVKPVIAKIDTKHMSRTQLKRHTKQMRSRGLNPDGSSLV